MDISLLIDFVKGMAIASGIVGIFAGLDLILGARVITALKKVLEKPTNIDEVLLKAASALRDKLDKVYDADTKIIKSTAAFREKLDRKAIDIDTPIMNTQVRIILGALFLFLSAIILLLIRIYK